MSAKSVEKPSNKTLVVTAYERIRAAIIGGELPAGSKLRIDELCVLCEIGASPIREALNRLAGEGLAVATSQRGFRVPVVSGSDLKDLARMRILLETEALRESIEVGDDAWEAGIVAAFHVLDRATQSKSTNVDRWITLNKEFHDSLVAACTSKLLLRIRKTLEEQLNRHRMLEPRSFDMNRRKHSEHKKIKNAVLKRDADAACEAIAKHFNRTMKHVLSSVPKTQDLSKD